MDEAPSASRDGVDAVADVLYRHRMKTPLRDAVRCAACDWSRARGDGASRAFAEHQAEWVAALWSSRDSTVSLPALPAEDLVERVARAIVGAGMTGAGLTIAGPLASHLARAALAAAQGPTTADLRRRS